VREVEQLVGRVAHRREHADHAASLLTCVDETPRDASQSFRSGYRRAAELHDDGSGVRARIVRRDCRDGLVRGLGHRGHCMDGADLL
jgi:hypothetical protein